MQDPGLRPDTGGWNGRSKKVLSHPTHHTETNHITSGRAHLIDSPDGEHRWKWDKGCDLNYANMFYQFYKLRREASDRWTWDTAVTKVKRKVLYQNQRSLLVDRPELVAASCLDGRVKRWNRKRIISPPTVRAFPSTRYCDRLVGLGAGEKKNNLLLFANILAGWRGAVQEIQYVSPVKSPKFPRVCWPCTIGSLSPDVMQFT